MQVTIAKESHRPDTGHCGPAGPYWVARNDAGCWVSYCHERFAANPKDAAVAMFHADEVESATQENDHATVTIKG